ncbi:MAG: hypothetical protein GXY48_06275 [Methanomicrobiales archaeon]|nr:hypothetical protein [Methanomicrobiales archaeon]
MIGRRAGNNTVPLRAAMNTAAAATGPTRREKGLHQSLGEKHTCFQLVREPACFHG